MIVLQPTTPNDLHSFTTTTRSLNQPNASIAVGPQPVQQSMYQTASYPAHATFVYSPATNSVTQQQQGYSSPRSSSSLPARPSSADNIPLESAAYSLHSNSTSYRYDCNQMAGGQESRSPQAQSSSSVIANEGVGQNYGATSDPRVSVGVSSSPQQASLGANMLPPLSEVLQQPPPPQQQQQPQSQQQGQHQQQHQQHQPQQQVQNQQGQQPQVQVQNQQGQQQQVQNQNQQQQQQQQPPTPQQQPPQQSQPRPQSGSSSPAASPTQPHHASSGSLMPPAAAAAAAAAAQSVTAGFYHQMGQYPDVSAYASQDGTYAAQASLMPPTQQQAAMVQQSMNQLGQQTSQLVTVVDPRLPPIAAAQGGDLQTANLSTSLVDPSVRRLAISTANMAMNQPESAGSSTASPIMPSATNALNNYQHLLNTPFMTATHPVMMAPPRSLHGRRDVADPSMHAMVERPQQKVYSFVPLPGINTKKRPRRRYDEIERHYACNWAGCSKAYGTLNHLNAHVQMQKHGAKRHPSEFKELRKMWRRQKREEEERKAAESAAVKQSSVATVNINGITGLHSV